MPKGYNSRDGNAYLCWINVWILYASQSKGSQTRAIEDGADSRVPLRDLCKVVHYGAPNLNPELEHLSLQHLGWSARIVHRLGKGPKGKLPWQVLLNIDYECVDVKSEFGTLGKLVLVKVSDASGKILVPDLASSSAQDIDVLNLVIVD